MMERVTNDRNQDSGLREGKGKSAERGAMGVVDLPSEKFLPREITDSEREGRYVSFRDSLKLAKEHQPWENPTKPSPLFASKLRGAVLAAMPLLPQSLHENLKFFTSVGSPLDRYHGIDAFLEFEVMGKDPIRVTLDITMRPGKDIWKTDILFSVGQVNVETFTQDISKGDYDDIINRVAQAAAAFIFKRLTNKPTEQIFIPKEKAQDHA